jgi:hypothetical protein
LSEAGVETAHPVIIELCNCLEQGDGAERFVAKEGLGTMLEEALAELAGDPDFYEVARNVAKFAIALQQAKSASAAQVLIGVLRSERIARAIQASAPKGSNPDLALAGKTFEEFTSTRDAQPIKSEEPVLSWLEARVGKKKPR